MLAKSLNSDKIACELINHLTYEYDIWSEQLVAIMHNCALANNVAIHTLKILFPLLLSIGCCSHTLNRIGEKFNVPNVDDFTSILTVKAARRSYTLWILSN